MFPCRIVAKHMSLMLPFELWDGPERNTVPKLLAVGSVASFDLSVLRRLPRINEEVGNTSCVTGVIKRMQARRQWIGALSVSRVVVRED